MHMCYANALIQCGLQQSFFSLVINLPIEVLFFPNKRAF